MQKIKSDLEVTKRLVDTLQVHDSFSAQKQMIKDKLISIENDIATIEAGNEPSKEEVKEPIKVLEHPSKK